MPYKDPVKRKEYREKYYEQNKKKENENSKKDYEQNKEKYKDQIKEYYEKNREKQKETMKNNYEKNKEQKNEYCVKRSQDHKQNALDSITVGEIIDRSKWDKWCNEIKRTVKQNKHPYSNNFTNDIMFDMMLQGCFYCGDIATTIDRVDSKLGHTVDNCVGCCHGCNISKGAVDLSTFIRKAYYRVRGEYYDEDTDIWFVYKTKPRMCDYKYRAKKKGVSFELTYEEFDILIKGDCAYCHRSPITWFGVDRVIPSLGYVLGNVVSCCYDCNIDKLEDDVESMRTRNERIAARVDAGDIVIGDCEKVILLRALTKAS